MKKHLLLFLFLFPVLLSAQIEWEDLTSPPGSEIIKILSGPDDIVYLQLRYDFLYRSFNNGNDWELITLPTSSSITSWTVAEDGSLYVLFYDSIFYLSAATGEWVSIPNNNFSSDQNIFITI